MSAPAQHLSEFEETVSTLAKAAAHDERLASDYARLGAYMAGEARTSAAELFESLSRYHAIRALEERGQLGAAVYAQHGVVDDPEEPEV
ncbi:hypothetical protein [Methylobacterium nigriterrae]|uniref:hypothetical protein n=1 Tax=Methylobacterium nigriterrae TaxID=3127512 RepID=UPI0030134A1C